MTKAVFLDADTIGDPKLLDPLRQLPLNWVFYGKTANKEVKERIADAEIVVTNKVIVKKDLKNATKLRLIAIPATGYDHIDIEEAKKRNVLVCNAPAYSTKSVAQHTMMFLLALGGSLIPYDEAVKKGGWHKSPLFTFLHYPIYELEGKTLGLIGYGDIGKQVEELAKAFGMRVLIAKHPTKEITGALPIDSLLQESDYISLHVPLKKETLHLIGEKELKLMKPSAYIINTARGKLIDETALLRALRNKEIAGAALDVLSEEPPPSSHPLLQEDIPNLIITPHTAWASYEARERLMKILSSNIESYLQDKCQNVVNP